MGKTVTRLYRTVQDTVCPACKTRLAWDALGFDLRDRPEITGWCSVCKKHVFITLRRSKGELYV